MNEKEFHVVADKTLDLLMDGLEEADARGDIELEYEAGVMTIMLPSGKQFVVSKHAPTKQLWLSSPVSGGLHFGYHNGGWRLSDERSLEDVLLQELKNLANVRA